jgi:ubiquinone/menaquinone biosynthesis C-methylase UbiE
VAAIAKAYLRPEMTVADIGCGTGFIAAGLAPLVRQVIALDGSPAMLDQARQNLKHFPNIIFQQADGLSLPLPDWSVDAVFANMYLHHCPDPLAAIREMARILRPGGRLVITDLEAHPHAWLKEEMADVWQGFERNQVHEWLREAGLVNRIVEFSGHSCCAEIQTAPAETTEPKEANIRVFVSVASQPLAGMREQVRQRYGARAEGKGGSCCAPQPDAPVTGGCCAPAVDQSGCCAPNSLAPVSSAIAPGYTVEQIQAVPEQAAEIALGCGNPTALAGLRPGEVVVDIGSGGGLDAILAGKAVGPTGRVIGVDMTPQMLERARAAAEKAGLSQVEFRAGQAEALPVEDASADAVISNCVINLTEDKSLAFAEAFRVLRPGGRLEISDIVTDRAFPLDLQTDPAGWAECVSGALPEGEYLDLIREAGFVQITARRSAADHWGDVRIYSLAVSARKPEK